MADNLFRPRQTSRTGVRQHRCAGLVLYWNPHRLGRLVCTSSLHVVKPVQAANQAAAPRKR